MVRAVRLNESALEEKKRRMRDDPLILIRPETESVKLHNTHPRLVKTVRYELLQEKQNAGVDIHRFVREQKELRSIMRTLAKSESKNPGILRLITRSDNGAEIAVKFGISRQRVNQLKKKMQRYAILERVAFSQVWVNFT